MIEMSSFIKGISDAMGKESDGGATITAVEIESLKELSPDVPETFIDLVATMLGTRDTEGVILTDLEITELRRNYPELTDKLIASMQVQCHWPGNIRLFSSKSAIATGPSYIDTLHEEALYLKEELHFPQTTQTLVDSILEYLSQHNLENNVDILHSTLRSKEFVDFIMAIRKLYPLSTGFKELTLKHALSLFAQLDETQRAQIVSPNFATFAIMLMADYQTNCFDCRRAVETRQFMGSSKPAILMPMG